MIEQASISQSNNKRIARNTLLLYFRMILMMGVSLYTVRVVLNTLGVVDYGIYNVVGGIVTTFSFLSGTMATASQRFFAFELGRKNFDQLKKTFSMTMTIYILIGIVILILAETAGLWFLNNKMTIPVERIEAANWIYQFAILSFMLTMFAIPYNAAIIAHECMEVYAYVSIIEVFLKLLIVYILVELSLDKLKLYAFLMFIVTGIITSIYQVYCRRNYKECNFFFYWDKILFNKIFSYSGWNLFGALAGVLNVHGINIVLNIFYGPILNTAQSITIQVTNTINQFVQNFMTATKPQIIKYYASGQIDNMNNLIILSSKFSFFLLLLISLPVQVYTNFFFNIWLKYIPEHVVTFTRVAIIVALIDSLSYPLQTAAQASGKIKLYQIIVGGVLILNLPLVYIVLYIEHEPLYIYYISLFISILTLLLRLLLLREMIQFEIIYFFKNVLMPTLLVFVLSSFIYYALYYFFENSVFGILKVIFLGTISTILMIFFIGLSKVEKKYALNNVKKYLQTK